MLETYIRPIVQKSLVDTLAFKVRQWGISANMITLLATLVGLLILPALVFDYPLWAVLFLGITGYLDMLDGSVARLGHQSSALGAVLDIVSDRLVEFVCVLSLYLVAPEVRGLYGMLMLGSILLCVTSFLVVGIFSNQESEKSFYYSPGLIERPEAFIFFVFMMLFPSLFNSLAIIFSLLVLLTTILRLSAFYRFCSKL